MADRTEHEGRKQQIRQLILKVITFCLCSQQGQAFFPLCIPYPCIQMQLHFLTGVVLFRRNQVAHSGFSRGHLRDAMAAVHLLTYHGGLNLQQMQNLLRLLQDTNHSQCGELVESSLLTLINT